VSRRAVRRQIIFGCSGGLSTFLQGFCWLVFWQLEFLDPGAGLARIEMRLRSQHHLNGESLDRSRRYADRNKPANVRRDGIRLQPAQSPAQAAQSFSVNSGGVALRLS
jgi:hypothetical protein